jgi:hypothetical protein
MYIIYDEVEYKNYTFEKNEQTKQTKPNQTKPNQTKPNQTKLWPTSNSI